MRFSTTGWNVAVLLGLGLWLGVTDAAAGPVLDRIRTAQTLHCAAAGRPGFAEARAAGDIGGLAVDLCRAVAVAVLGKEGRIVFGLLDSSRDYDAVRDGTLDLMFLGGTEIKQEGLASHVVPGPTVFVEQFALMVPETSSARMPEDLGGTAICFMIGSAAQRALEAGFEASGTRFSRLGFEEDVEMQDAYNVGRCQAMADAATRLGAMREDGGVDHLRSRLLARPLGLYPLVAATGAADAAWSALVAWLIDDLIGADQTRSGWHGAGAGLDKGEASRLGLRNDWQAEVATTVGSYGDMMRRNLGEDSPLHLVPGPNAPWPAGLLLPPITP